MATVTLKGNPFQTAGILPQVGTQAPDFSLVATDLSEVSLSDYKGSRVMFLIFFQASIQGPVAASVRAFNEKASGLDNTKVLCISKDLPFAMARFCGAEGLNDVISLSDFRNGFASNYPVDFVDGPLKGLLSRSVIVLDEEGNVLYNEQVAETVDEPNYEAALASLK